MKAFLSKKNLSALIAGTLLLILTNIALANHASGSWYKNGVHMSANHHVEFGPGSLERQMWSNSNAQTPAGVAQALYTDARLEDRCKNADGTWRAWNLYGFNNATANWVYSVGTYARGQYQSCQYGHEYRNRSLHNFRHDSFGVNEQRTLCSGKCSG